MVKPRAPIDDRIGVAERRNHLLARYNLRTNRADRRGAARLAIGLIVLEIVAWVFGAHHVGSADAELRQLMPAIALMTFLGGTVWLLYLAIEPYVRRFWPDGLLGWTRLMSGRIRDARVGRDVLFGLLFAAGMMTLETAYALLPQHWGQPAPLPPFGNVVAPLATSAYVIARWIMTLSLSLQNALFLAMIFIVLRLLLRRGWLAAVVGAGLLLVLADGGKALTGTWMDTALNTLVVALLTGAVFRFGLLVLAVALFADNVATTLPLTLHASAWWATPSNLTIALLVALACFGYYAARAGQPLFGKFEV